MPQPSSCWPWPPTALSADSARAAAESLRRRQRPQARKSSAGDLARGLEIQAAGGEIDYVGATNVELLGPGEAGRRTTSSKR